MDTAQDRSVRRESGLGGSTEFVVRVLGVARTVEPRRAVWDCVPKWHRDPEQSERRDNTHRGHAKDVLLPPRQGLVRLEQPPLPHVRVGKDPIAGDGPVRVFGLVDRRLCSKYVRSRHLVVVNEVCNIGIKLLDARRVTLVHLHRVA